MLHWANKDQYYTKSGESFSNYAFTLENGKKVQFRLVEADTAKDNRKDNDQTRVFALIEPKIKIETDENGEEIQTDIRPIEQNSDELTIRFEYIAIQGTEKQRTKLQKEYILQAVEKIKAFAISDDFQEMFTLKPTEENKTRTLLEKYLTDYTAKNTADYFIHKNLGKFLNQELDFYIKNEVMNLDNIQESTDFSHIEQNLQTIKTLKTVAKEIIAFLAQLENFQKKLWLKKKFVAGCHYLITLDHLTEEQMQTALANPKQTAQWLALFNVNASGLSAVELCKNYPHLVVDTSLFEPTFQAEILSNLHDLDEKMNGLLIHSDNFQALNLLQERYKEQVKCIYIDPPYNTDGDGFIYKDGYKHSSWLSLIENRITLQKNLMSKDGTLGISIDDNEVHELDLCVSNIMNNQKIGELSVTRAEGGGLAKRIVKGHDYLMLYAKDLDICPPLLRSKDIRGKIVTINGEDFWIETDWLRIEFGKYGTLLYEDIEKVKGTEKKQEIDDGIASGKYILIKKDNNHIVGRYRSVKEDGSKFYSVIKHLNTDGTAVLKELFPTGGFGYPKPVSLISQYVLGSTFSSVYKNAIVLDYFAGSGTTAHAVINLNREDNGNRKYILVEQGEYFDSVLKPRVQKVIFAKEWKDGKPQADNGVFGGVSQIVKVLKLESYEDTLNNLELRKPIQDLADMGLSETVQNDYLLHYMLDVESRDSLLNTQHFTKPFDYKLNIATTSAGAYEAKTIDLVETFNYLIGLRVRAIDDQREKRGWVTVKGKLANDDNALIIWRDCEKIGYGELNDFIRKNAYGVEDKAEYSEETFKVVYINGDHNVPTVFTDSDDSVKTLKVRSIEAEFFSRMFG